MLTSENLSSYWDEHETTLLNREGLADKRQDIETNQSSVPGAQQSTLQKCSAQNVVDIAKSTSEGQGDADFDVVCFPVALFRGQS